MGGLLPLISNVKITGSARAGTDKTTEIKTTMSDKETTGPIPVDRQVRLYAWQPDGHGQYSFFVLAESEEQARRAVETEIERLKKEPDSCVTWYEHQGWGTDYYNLTVADVGQVIINAND